MKKIDRKRFDWVRVSVIIREDQKENLLKLGINFSEFVREKIDELLYIPLFVVRVEGESSIPEGSVILLPVEERNKIKVVRGKEYIRDGAVKYYVKEVGWEGVKRRRYVYVYE